MHKTDIIYYTFLVIRDCCLILTTCKIWREISLEFNVNHNPDCLALHKIFTKLSCLLLSLSKLWQERLTYFPSHMEKSMILLSVIIPVLSLLYAFSSSFCFSSRLSFWHYFSYVHSCHNGNKRFFLGFDLPLDLLLFWGCQFLLLSCFSLTKAWEWEESNDFFLNSSKYFESYSGARR